MLSAWHDEAFNSLDPLVEALHSFRSVVWKDVAPQFRPKSDHEIDAAGRGSRFPDCGNGGSEFCTIFCVEEIELQVRMRRSSKSEDSGLGRVHTQIVSIKIPSAKGPGQEENLGDIDDFARHSRPMAPHRRSNDAHDAIDAHGLW